MHKSIRSVLVLGGGTAGWMTANLLACEPGWEKINITLVESSDIGTVGVGEGSLPTMRQFFQRIGVSEAEWMPHCDATYKCGIDFTGWSEEAGHKRYFHPFFSRLDEKPASMFYEHCQMRRQGKNTHAHPDQYFVTSELVRQHKSPIPHNPLPFEHDYAYHFNAGLLAAYLKELACSRGVTHIVDTVPEVRQSEDGSISSLLMEKTGELTADFYIDCSGFAGVLINKTLKVPFISFKENMFNDAAIAIATPQTEGPMPSQTLSHAMKCGWSWRIPLTSRFGNGYVYSSYYLSADDAEQELRAHLGEEAKDAEARHLKMRVGRVTEPWHKNCLAVGLSQGFIEPLEATALGIIQYSVEHFLKAFKKEQTMQTMRSNYNKGANRVYERIRDYIVLHYQLNKRTDTEYWIANRNNQHISDTLVEILEVWDNGGDIQPVIKRGRGVYMLPSWYCMLSGMGRFPKTSGTASEQSLTNAKKAREFCKTVAEGFKDHKIVLESFNA